MKLRFLQKADWFIGLTLSLILAPITRVLGMILRREHSFSKNDTIVVMKLLGGGNFALAMPMLLGLRQSFPDSKLVVVVTPSTAQFAKTLGVFDEIKLIDTGSLPLLIGSAMRTLLSLFRVDVIIDLEVHSKLSTCFGLFTCARNRLGFFTNDFFLRKYLYTHLVFFNPRAPRSALFERFAALLGARCVDPEECEMHLKSKLNISAHPNSSIAIGVGCSDLGRVRQLRSCQWVSVLKKELASVKDPELIFLGSQMDWDLAQEVGDKLQIVMPSLRISNLCGARALSESLRLLGSCSRFYAIDSGLLHFARLLGVPSTSFWGPTDPATLLIPLPRYTETIHYKPLLCSPCIHVAEVPPCGGRNLCMTALFQEEPISDSEVLANVTVGPDDKSSRTSTLPSTSLTRTSYGLRAK